MARTHSIDSIEAFFQNRLQIYRSCELSWDSKCDTFVIIMQQRPYSTILEGKFEEIETFDHYRCDKRSINMTLNSSMGTEQGAVKWENPQELDIYFSDANSATELHRVLLYLRKGSEKAWSFPHWRCDRGYCGGSKPCRKRKVENEGFDEDLEEASDEDSDEYPDGGLDKDNRRERPLTTRYNLRSAPRRDTLNMAKRDGAILNNDLRAILNDNLRAPDVLTAIEKRSPRSITELSSDAGITTKQEASTSSRTGTPTSTPTARPMPPPSSTFALKQAGNTIARQLLTYFQQVEARADSQQADVTTVTSRVQDLSQQLEEQKVESATLRDQNNALRKEIARLKHTGVDVQKMKQLESELAGARTETQALQKDLGLLKGLVERVSTPFLRIDVDEFLQLFHLLNVDSCVFEPCYLFPESIVLVA